MFNLNELIHRHGARRRLLAPRPDPGGCGGDLPAVVLLGARPLQLRQRPQVAQAPRREVCQGAAQHEGPAGRGDRPRRGRHRQGRTPTFSDVGRFFGITEEVGYSDTLGNG